MLDLKFIRDNLDAVKAGLKAKRVEISLAPLMALDQKRRDLTVKIEDLRTGLRDGINLIVLLK